MAIDVSWISEGMPLFTFALVFVVAYAILAKTKVLGGDKWVNIIVSVIFAIILISFSSVQNYLAHMTLWFTVILTVLFFFVLIVYFTIAKPESFMKPLAIISMILLALIVIIAIFYNFHGTRAYLPGHNEAGANDFFLSIKHFVLGEKFLSGALLLIIAVVVGFIIAKWNYLDFFAL